MSMHRLSMPAVWAAVFIVLVLFLAPGSIRAQSPADLHGISIGKGCLSPRIPGEHMECWVSIRHADAFGDTIRVDYVEDTLWAWDGPHTFGPLEISEVSGNAWCTDPAGSGEHRTEPPWMLPCYVGPEIDGAGRGRIQLVQDQYVLHQEDLGTLPDVFIATVMDLCNGDPRGRESCNSEHKFYESFGASTVVVEVRIEKTAEELCKVGDEVHYQFVILVRPGPVPGSEMFSLLSISDSLLGDLADEAAAAGCNQLPLGGSCSFTVPYVVQPGGPDPITNTVTATYTLGDKPEMVMTDTHSVNLFVPGVEVLVEGGLYDQPGDVVDFLFTVNSVGTADSPDLLLDSIGNSLLGDLTDEAMAAGCDRLPPGASCSFTVSYTTQPGDPNPLVSTTTVHYHPEGFPNDVTEEVVHPPQLPPGEGVGGIVDYTGGGTSGGSAWAGLIAGIWAASLAAAAVAARARRRRVHR